MKTVFLTLAVALLLAPKISIADPYVMMKQKARDIANQNNVQQGVTPPANSSPVAPPAAPAGPPPPTLSPELQAFLNLNNSLGAIKPDAAADQREKLAAALKATAHGAKPSGGLLDKLSADLTTAMAGKTVSPASRGRMTQDIVAVMNSSALPQAQLADIIADVPALLKKSGSDEKAAAVVGEDLKTIADGQRKKS
jgi:hypothetical protein